MIQGTVKWFNEVKGYGFITPDDNSEEVFVHYSGIQGEGRKSLTIGQKVEFEIAETPRGLQAKDVRVIKEDGNVKE